MRRVVTFGVAVLLITALAFPTQLFAAFSDYTDIQPPFWASSFLEELYDAGAIDDPPPLYRPNDPIERGRFAKYLVLGWGLEPYVGTEQFLSDVPSTNPYFAYANALYTRGLMVGSGGVFGVSDSLLRIQAATVLVRAAGLEAAAMARPADEAKGICELTWSDAASIPTWALPYAAQAYVSGLFVGDAVGTLRPNDAMSKAEAATVVTRVQRLKPALDFGDAPDWPKYFLFPSLLGSDGARHQDLTAVWLGERVDGEIDSRQVNSDFFDDGFVRFIMGGAAAPTCQLEFEVSVASRDPSLYKERSLYFNLLIDFDQDMVWDTVEWVVQNMAIDPNAWPTGVTTETLKTPSFLAPSDPYGCWFRMTLAWGEKAPTGWVGQGQFLYGETEDYGPEEQKMVVLRDLEAMQELWSASKDQRYQQVAKELDDAIWWLKDLIKEEQADDPVQVLIKKKLLILDYLYEAAQLAYSLDLSDSDLAELERLWKLMAFVTEEEMKRFNVHLLRETLRLNFGLPADINRQIHDLLDQLADLIWEQERGDPPSLLLPKKDKIIAALQSLIGALDAAKLKGPADNARSVLAWMLFIKALEEPKWPPPPPGQTPDDPPWWPPDDEQPPTGPGETPPLGQAPTLPGLVTGVSSIFTVTDGRVVMKVHLTSLGPANVHDIEIYYAHQRGWPTGAALDPVSGPDGWSTASGTAGVGWYGESPLVACQPYYFTFDTGGADIDSITFLLTDASHRPIGHSSSQETYAGSLVLPPEQGANLADELSGGEWAVDSFFDVFFTIEAGAAAMVSTLRADTGSGGIFALPDGPSELLPGGYLPSDGYGTSAQAVEGQYYALRDHTGSGYALLYVVDVGPNGCLVSVEWNPRGTLVMVAPVPLP